MLEDVSLRSLQLTLFLLFLMSPVGLFCDLQCSITVMPLSAGSGHGLPIRQYGFC